MKRFLSITLALMLALSLMAGCTTDNNATDRNDGANGGVTDKNDASVPAKPENDGNIVDEMVDDIVPDANPNNPAPEDAATGNDSTVTENSTVTEQNGSTTENSTATDRTEKTTK